MAGWVKTQKTEARTDPHLVPRPPPPSAFPPSCSTASCRSAPFPFPAPAAVSSPAADPGSPSFISLTRAIAALRRNAITLVYGTSCRQKPQNRHESFCQFMPGSQVELDPYPAPVALLEAKCKEEMHHLGVLQRLYPSLLVSHRDEQPTGREWRSTTVTVIERSVSRVTVLGRSKGVPDLRVPRSFDCAPPRQELPTSATPSANHRHQNPERVCASDSACSPNPDTPQAEAWLWSTVPVST